MSNSYAGTLAEKYHKQSDGQFLAGKKAIDSLDLKGDEQILDIGCRTGRISNDCSDKLTTGSIVAISTSQEMIKFASEEYKTNSKIKFECVDVAELNYENKFDIVYSFYCLQWVKEQQKAIGNIVRSLKSGGKGLFYISCANYQTESYLKARDYVLENNSHLASDAFINFNFRPADDYIGWLKDAGIKSVDHSFVEKKRVFESKENLKKFLISIGVEPKMSESQRGEFLDKLIDKLYVDLDLSEGDSFDYVTTALTLLFEN